MDDKVRMLIREVCNGDISRIRTAATIVLKSCKTKKDEEFCTNSLKKLESIRNFMELPSNLKGMLVAEDVSVYPEEKYFWREDELEIAEKVISMYKVADTLQEKGIRYIPSLILYGESGCGKTELARYIAHLMNLPYVYIRFSSLIDSHLGETNKNISKIFDFLRGNQCVVCFDEIDAIGLERGQRNEVGEMSRIVISLMQELDTLPNGVVVIGTTNRFDMLDKALVRRFSISHEVKKLTVMEAKATARKFLKYAGLSLAEIQNYIESIVVDSPTYTVIRDCTEFVADKLLKEIEYK